MKKGLIIILIVCWGMLNLQGIDPYLLLSESPADMASSIREAKSVLVEKGYTILGEYAPAGDEDLHVVVFSNDELLSLATQLGKIETLAAVMKLGFHKQDGKVDISLVNPDYLFHAYFREAMDQSDTRSRAEQLTNSILSDLSAIGGLNRGFGGDVEEDKLWKYRYMVGMPRFDDVVELQSFNSFDEALSIIGNNLESGKGSVTKVYEIVDQERQVAIFGVGLLDSEIGESHFLSIIGKDHVAAMPYELVLAGKEAVMLHGRYRFALHWPELTMGTFTKIMSTPGDVEDSMKALTE